MGFRSNRGSEVHLWTLANDFGSDRSKFFLMVDFKKAFDSVPHAALFDLLRYILASRPITTEQAAVAASAFGKSCRSTPRNDPYGIAPELWVAKYENERSVELAHNCQFCFGHESRDLLQAFIEEAAWDGEIAAGMGRRKRTVAEWLFLGFSPKMM
eukprot:TRINITY_DN19153_c0_g3_i1.p2 TRINITY_DN19153_c0_g3~~TRINITY_DN19153_c0_g3_i1.p2  ORF type:complete len:156 (+),score=27.45 TRINITY_DN19153_c0_g3_i1:314-781(+)